MIFGLRIAQSPCFVYKLALRSSYIQRSPLFLVSARQHEDNIMDIATPRRKLEPSADTPDAGNDTASKLSGKWRTILKPTGPPKPESQSPTKAEGPLSKLERPVLKSEAPAVINDEYEETRGAKRRRSGEDNFIIPNQPSQPKHVLRESETYSYVDNTRRASMRPIFSSNQVMEESYYLSGSQVPPVYSHSYLHGSARVPSFHTYNSRISRHPSAIGRNQSIKFPKSSFHPGTIIRAALHEQHLLSGARDSDVSFSDPSRTNSRFGPIHTKIRKAIVIATYEDHYVTVPLYTHNGNGLANKRNQDEYVSIRDHRTLNVPFTQLSNHDYLLTEDLKPGIDLYHPFSTAHLTYPVSRKYDLPVIMEGHLDDRSTKHVVDLYCRWAVKGTRKTMLSTIHTSTRRRDDNKT